ncbi:MAG TPA: carbamoyl-phosphate-synthetase [Terriglobia bacterium]|nr:carbamoyl-phosphate-synthetase [Terriglobia bacterium]
MTSVALTGLHRGENPQPGAAVAASLRRRFPNLRIIGLCYDPLESALYSNDGSRPDAAYLIPYPGVGPRAVLERLDEILKREKLDFIIPCLDSEIGNFIELEPELRTRGISCMLPSKDALEARSKVKLPEFCRKLEILTPRTAVVADASTLALRAQEIGYPVYVKGRFYEAHLATSPQELWEAYNKIVSVWGGPVLVQETVVGEEYDIVGLGDGKGGLIGSCSIRKMLRTSAGKGFAGIVVDDPALNDLVRRVIAALRWAGPFELEFIKVPNRPHALFEMNPRFPAWVDFPSQIDCNLPVRLLEGLLHHKPEPLRHSTPGQMFIRHSIDLVADIGDVARFVTTGQRIEDLGRSADSAPLESELAT